MGTTSTSGKTYQQEGEKTTTFAPVFKNNYYEKKILSL